MSKREFTQNIANPFTDTVSSVVSRAAEEFLDWASTQSWYPSLWENQGGKMFGVLVIKHEETIYFLAGFSGMLQSCWQLPRLVKPVFDIDRYGRVLIEGNTEITRLTHMIEALEKSSELTGLKNQLLSLEEKRDQEYDRVKTCLSKRKIQRNILRNLKAEQCISQGGGTSSDSLIKQSQSDSRQWRELKTKWAKKVNLAQAELGDFISRIEALKVRRGEFSGVLQQELFTHFKLINRNNEVRTMSSFFKGKLPPGGTGDCAAPKLLNHAHKRGYSVISLGEFWLGSPPASGLRRHGRFYPPCRSRCAKILPWMLKGYRVGSSETISTIPQVNSKSLDISIVYKDEHVAVVEKPAGLLSVPGKIETDCVHARVIQLFSSSQYVYMAHRLDFDTSGLLIIARSKSVYRDIQRQFLGKLVNKRYDAIVDGWVESDSGKIELPIRVDLDDRPRQLVCASTGKASQTEFMITERFKKNGRRLSRVRFFPLSGRTHQLRVHAAHADGLNAPIIGDPLYGVGQEICDSRFTPNNTQAIQKNTECTNVRVADRMLLHATSLSFTHPVSGQTLDFESVVPF